MNQWKLFRGLSTVPATKDGELANSRDVFTMLLI